MAPATFPSVSVKKLHPKTVCWKRREPAHPGALDVGYNSPSAFVSAFRRQLGTTPARYVEHVRLEAAKLRLENRDGSIERIAADCGFGSAVNLRRVCQRHLGIGPREYVERFGRI